MTAMLPRIKFRSMPLQVLIFIVTFGLYGLYWFYQTAMEMREATADYDAAPALWLILLFIPFGSLFSWYFYSALFEKWSEQSFNRWLLWVLWIIFSPAVWFIVQSELNRRSTYH